MPKKQRARRRRGDGSVIPAKYDKKGRVILWRGMISLGTITIDGKKRRHRPTIYAPTEAEAHQMLKRLQAKHLMGDDLTPGKQTVDAYWPRFLAHIKAIDSPGTCEVYERNGRNHILPSIGSVKLRTLKTSHCQIMLDALPAKGLAPSSVKLIRAILIRALNVARKLGDLPKGAANAAIDTEIAAIPEKRPPSLTEAQLNRLLGTIAGDPLEPLILVALGTGARIGECLGLLWSNVLFDEQELHILGALKRRKNPQPKQGKQYILIRESFTKARDQRVTRLSPPVATALLMQRERQHHQWEQAGDAWETSSLIFTDDHGRPLDPTAIDRRFKALAEAAGLPDGFTFHGLRHSAATFLIKDGASQRVLMQALGHKNARTSARYGQVLEEVTSAALDQHAQRLTRRGGEK